jgi:hypothetical protein
MAEDEPYDFVIVGADIMTKVMASSYLAAPAPAARQDSRP